MPPPPPPPPSSLKSPPPSEPVEETARRLLALDDKQTGGVAEFYSPIRPTPAYPNPHDSDTPRAKLLETLVQVQVDHALVARYQQLPIEAQLLLCNTCMKMTHAYEKRSLTTLLQLASTQELGCRRHERTASWHVRYRALADLPHQPQKNDQMDGYTIDFYATIHDLVKEEVLSAFQSLSAESKKWLLTWLTYLPLHKHTSATATLLCGFCRVYFETRVTKPPPPPVVASCAPMVECVAYNSDDDEDEDYSYVPSEQDTDMDEGF